jgi:hypothetical protein
MVRFALTAWTLALGLDAKQKVREVSTEAGHGPIDVVADLPGSHVKTEDAAPVEHSGMRDEEPRSTSLTEGAAETAEVTKHSASLTETAEETAEVTKDTANLTERAEAEVKKHIANPSAQSREIPYYFFSLPVAVKFVDEQGKARIAIADRITLPGELPIEVMYVYPLVFFVCYSLVWCLCCRRSNRSGLSFRLVIESAVCFMCLWADLATKHKAVGSGRAWSYVFAMVFVLSAWNIAELWFKDDEKKSNIVFWAFQGVVALVWTAYSVERVFVRKFYRRSADPVANSQPVTDCVAVACCGQLTAMQEAQLMATLQEEQKPRDTATNW